MIRSPLLPLALAAALLGGGCATRIVGGVDDDLDGGPPVVDLAQPPDLAAAPLDLTTAPADLRTPGKSCGQIMQCMIGCGLMLGQCQLGCFQGASAKGAQQAATLLACAAQKCVLGATDGGNGGSIFVCLFTKCGSQVQMCEGLGFGGN